jgi:hypothetical protein
MSDTSIELKVTRHPDADGVLYMACWNDGEPLVHHLPECWLDLMPFLAARRLLEQGYNLQRLLIVRLHGADLDMVRASLGAVAATPLVNTAAPVKAPLHCVYRKGERYRG